VGSPGAQPSEHLGFCPSWPPVDYHREPPETTSEPARGTPEAESGKENQLSSDYPLKKIHGKTREWRKAAPHKR
jgi:hypothetical protein